MSIVGWHDPSTGRIYGLDQVDKLGHLLPAFLLQMLARNELSDTRHTGDAFTTTSAIGCPRQFAISRALPTTPNPFLLWPAEGGTMIHSSLGMEAATEVDEEGVPLWYTEEVNPERCIFNGKIGGYEISGKLDLLSRSCWDAEDKRPKRIWDWKTSFANADKYIEEDADGMGIAKPEVQIQLSINASLVEQTTNIDLGDAELAAWVVSKGWKKCVAKRLTWEECRRTTVCATKYTTEPYSFGALWDHTVAFLDTWRKEGEKYGSLTAVPQERMVEIIKGMPLYGENIFNNKLGQGTCHGSCPYKRNCDNIEGGL